MLVLYGWRNDANEDSLIHRLMGSFKKLLFKFDMQKRFKLKYISFGSNIVYFGKLPCYYGVFNCSETKFVARCLVFSVSLLKNAL